MTPEQLVEKWKGATLSERAASHEHFLDLCRLLDQPTPAQSDRTGIDYAFEKPVHPAAAASKGYGFVDVWKRGHCGWEYKRQGKYKDFTEAYRQLYQYREDLDNPAPCLSNFQCDNFALGRPLSFNGNDRSHFF
jgi:hypothetical protein